MTTRIYQKAPLSINGLIEHLSNRGLIIDDEQALTEALRFIGYHRLLIYVRHFQNTKADPKIFRDQTRSSDIVSLYEFDRALRILCIDALERIEVALRSVISNQISMSHSQTFYSDPNHFSKFKEYAELFAQLGRARHQSIKHYYESYHEPMCPPIWAVLEGLSFGPLSRLYSQMKRPLRRKCEEEFGLPESILVSWFRTLATFRNKCAHHECIWNTRMVEDKPSIHRNFIQHLSNLDNLYTRLVVCAIILNQINQLGKWKAQLISLIENRPPSASLTEMGFPDGWRQTDIWK